MSGGSKFLVGFIAVVAIGATLGFAPTPLRTPITQVAASIPQLWMPKPEVPSVCDGKPYSPSQIHYYNTDPGKVVQYAAGPAIRLTGKTDAEKSEQLAEIIHQRICSDPALAALLYPGIEDGGKSYSRVESDIVTDVKNPFVWSASTGVIDMLDMGITYTFAPVPKGSFTLYLVPYEGKLLVRQGLTKAEGQGVTITSGTGSTTMILDYGLQPVSSTMFKNIAYGPGMTPTICRYDKEKIILSGTVACDILWSKKKAADAKKLVAMPTWG